MSVPSTVAALPEAPYQTRLRLSIFGVIIAWSMAAFFLLLAWQHRTAEIGTLKTPAVAVAHG